MFLQQLAPVLLPDCPTLEAHFDAHLAGLVRLLAGRVHFLEVREDRLDLAIQLLQQNCFLASFCLLLHAEVLQQTCVVVLNRALHVIFLASRVLFGPPLGTLDQAAQLVGDGALQFE